MSDRPNTTTNHTSNSPKNMGSFSDDDEFPLSKEDVAAMLDMENISDDDEFPLSQEDVAAMLALDVSNKRKFEDRADNPPAGNPPTKKLSIKPYPTTSKAAVEVLRREFGLSGFRMKQEAVISRILGGGSKLTLSNIYLFGSIHSFKHNELLRVSYFRISLFLFCKQFHRL